jgi:3'(2'), 5'-bisphosphate nucleotidase
LDPIDGTKGFLRHDQYAIALALVIDGQVQVGVLGCPNLRHACQPEMGGPGSLVVAARGQGAWTTPLTGPQQFTRLAISPQADPGRARLLRSFESGHTNVSQIDIFAQQLGIRAEPVRMDSQAKYAVLAAGQGDLLLRLLSPSQPDYREKIWDQAAGSLVLQEAGGMITDLDGKPLDFTTGRSLLHNRGILASNQTLHPAALQALRAIGA